MFDMFSVSSKAVVKLTTWAMSKRLVRPGLLRLVNDKVKVYTTTERANELLQHLHGKSIYRTDVEEKVFQQFIECLKEDEFYKSTWENLGIVH